MAVSSISFQSVINRMSRLGSLHVRNHTTINRNLPAGQGTRAEKSTSIGKTGNIAGVEKGSRSALRTKSSGGSVSLGAAQKTGAGFRKITEKLQGTDWSREYHFSKKKELQKDVCTFAEEYNRFLSEVKNVPDGGGGVYGGKFANLLQDNKTALAGIGLFAEPDGTLTVDGSILKKAKAEAFAAVFAGADSVAGRAAVNSIYAEAQGTLAAVGKLYGYGAGLGAYGMGSLGMYGTGAYGMGSLGTYALGSLGTYGSESMAAGMSSPLTSYGLGGYGYGAYGYGASGLNSLYAALSSYAGRYIDTQL